MADRSVNGKDAAAAPDPAATAGAQRLPPSLARGDCAPRPRLAYAAEFTFVADGWQRSDGRMVRTTSAFLMRWTKRGLGLWSTGAWCAGSCASRQFANGPERGRFPGAHALPFPCPLLHAVRSNMRLFRSAPFSTTPFTLRHTEVRWWPIAFGTLSPPRTDCSETLK